MPRWKALGKLPPSTEGGVVTAGNASQQNDAAAACLVVAEDKLEELGLDPMPGSAAGQRRAAIRRAWASARCRRWSGCSQRRGGDDIGLVELNEAFAPQVLAVLKGWGWSATTAADILNVNGSGISLGHPIGATGGASWPTWRTKCTAARRATGLKPCASAAVRGSRRCSNHAATRAAVAQALAEGQAPSESLHDADLDTVRDQFRRFTDAEILPHAHKWHLANDLIPDEAIAAMAELGTFGVCIPEEFGGLGLGKLVMCLVTEELSRGWIGAGSLGTRSEIAGELITLGGTDAQKGTGCPGSPAGKSCRPPFLPNPIPAPISARSRQGRG
jgi:hypothetical protein